MKLLKLCLTKAQDSDLLLDIGSEPVNMLMFSIKKVKS